MSDPFCLVVNPAAAHGRASRRLPAVLTALAAGGGVVRVCESTSLSHAAELAVIASERGETVVAVGGDGLTGALAAAVAGVGGVLGLIPAGRGNDFARMLAIPGKPAEAASVLLTGQPRPVDLIGVQAGNSPEMLVAGSVYLGVPSEGGELANRSRWAAGSLGYQVAGVRALLAWQPATFTVETPAGEPPLTTFPGFCVVVANSAYLAAGKRAAPAASVTDRLLDVIMVQQDRKVSFLNVMLKAGRGSHLRLRQVSSHQADSVIVTADRAMPAAADGETLPFAAPLGAGLPLRIRVVPGAVRMIGPSVPGPASTGG